MPYFTATMPAHIYLARTLAALPATAGTGGGGARPTVGQIWPRPS